MPQVPGIEPNPTMWYWVSAAGKIKTNISYKKNTQSQMISQKTKG